MKKILCLTISILMVFSLSACSFLQDFADDYNVVDDSYTTDEEQDTIDEELNIETKDDEKDNSSIDIFQPDASEHSILSQENDAYAFTINGKEIALPVKYTEFMQLTNATSDIDVSKMVSCQKTECATINLLNKTAEIEIACFDTAEEKPITECYIIALCLDIDEQIVLKHDIKNTTNKSDVLEKYGTPGFQNASLDEYLIYYSLPYSSYDRYDAGIELRFTLDGELKNIKVGAWNRDYQEYVN